LDWPLREVQWFGKNKIEEKIEGKVPRERPRDKCMGRIKKKLYGKKYQEVSQLALDRVGWRAAVNQSPD
jgi:hypothetical protein